MQRFTLEAGGALVDETLDDLFALVASGSFPHTADPADCRFCPFRSICGDVAETAAQAERKRDSEPGDPLLDPVRAIERRGV